MLSKIRHLWCWLTWGHMPTGVFVRNEGGGKPVVKIVCRLCGLEGARYRKGG